MTVFHPPVDLPRPSRPSRARLRRRRRWVGPATVLLIVLMIGGPMLLQVIA